MAKETTNEFADYKKDALTKPRDMAWSNWAKFTTVGDKVQGYIRDAFFRKAEGDFDEQRGITLEQVDGTMVNVGIKRHPFVLDKTENLRIGDPLTVELIELKPAQTKGHSATKIFGFFGKNLEKNANEKTVGQLDLEDQKLGGSSGSSDVHVETPTKAEYDNFDKEPDLSKDPADDVNPFGDK